MTETYLRTAGEQTWDSNQTDNEHEYILNKLSEVLVSGFHYCWESTTSDMAVYQLMIIINIECT